jgi:hypothetical protein
VAYSFWNTLVGIGAGGRDPFARQLQQQLDPRYRQPMHICELTWDLIQRGALTLDKDANDHRIVTYHDSCNVARASRMGDLPGGQFTLPRAIIGAVVNRYVEMAPGTTHEQTYCCGGGGGLLTDELLELRVKGALPRMEALRQVADQHGVNFMATICAICKAQFSKVLPAYGFSMGMVGGVHHWSYGHPPHPTLIPHPAEISDGHPDNPKSSRRCGRRHLESWRDPSSGEFRTSADLHPVDALPGAAARPATSAATCRRRGTEKPPGRPWQEYAWPDRGEPSRR